MKGTFTIDRRACRGSGLCQAMGPAVFGRSEDGYPGTSSGELWDEGSVTLAEEAADCCPTGAITVRTERGGSGRGTHG